MIGRGNLEGAKAAFGAQNAASRADSQQDTLTESRRRKGREGGKKFHRDLRSRGGSRDRDQGPPKGRGGDPAGGGPEWKRERPRCLCIFFFILGQRRK